MRGALYAKPFAQSDLRRALSDPNVCVIRSDWFVSSLVGVFGTNRGFIISVRSSLGLIFYSVNVSKSGYHLLSLGGMSEVAIAMINMP